MKQNETYSQAGEEHSLSSGYANLHKVQDSVTFPSNKIKFMTRQLKHITSRKNTHTIPV
jgi:hypothetical protein